MEEQVRKAAEAEGESELDGNLGQDRARASEDHIGEWVKKCIRPTLSPCSRCQYFR